MKDLADENKSEQIQGEVPKKRRYRHKKQSQLSDDNKSKLLNFVGEVEKNPSLIQRKNLPSVLMPIKDAVIKLRQLGMSYPQISATLKEKTGLKVSPTYICNFIKKCKS